MTIEHRTVLFTVAVLYSLEERWRGIGTSQSFENILRNRRGVNLHMAWLKLKKEGLLGEFSDQFWFDTLYTVSNLTDILRVGHLRHLLVRLGGSDFSYHLDEVSPIVIETLLRRENISREFVDQVSSRLNSLLTEQEISVKSPTA